MSMAYRSNGLLSSFIREHDGDDLEPVITGAANRFQRREPGAHPAPTTRHAVELEKDGVSLATLGSEGKQPHNIP